MVFALVLCLVACRARKKNHGNSEGTSITSVHGGDSASAQDESASSGEGSQSSEQEGGDSSSQSSGDSSSQSSDDSSSQSSGDSSSEEPEVPVITSKVMLSAGFDIALPDYDPAAATTLEFDVYVTAARSPYTKVYWNLYDADDNYFGYYRITYAGLQATDASGYSIESTDTDTFHVTLVLSALAGGSGTPGKLVKLKDSGASVNLDGAWIDNIEFCEKANYTVTVEGGTGGGTYLNGSVVTVTATIPNGKNFVEWQVGGAKVAESTEYTFTVTGDVTLTAVFEDAAAGDTKVMLSAGFDIALSDYDPATATTLEFDIYAVHSNPYAKINIVFTDANGVSTKFYRVTYLGVNMGYNAEGVSCSQVSENTWHVVLTLSALTNGNGTSLGKLVKMTDSGSSNLNGCWIDNIEFKN